MRTICAIFLAATFAFSQTYDQGERLFAEAKDNLSARNKPEAERLLREALQYWAPVEPKPPEYVEALGLLGIVVEGRLYKEPEKLRTELEPDLEIPAKQFLGFPGRDVMAARVLEVYGILLQRTGRESEAKPIFARAKTLRFSPTEATGGPSMSKLSEDGPFKIGGGVSAPNLLQKTEPAYAQDAALAHHQGMVVIFLVVEENGYPRDVQVLHNLGLGLDEKAIEAVKKWVFRPGEKDGVPVAVQATIQVNFRLL